ncbi:hypothetical protein [Pseudomonas fluorescens]|uniref:Uncharacterized protein n=1 Tax=Pseudomonas fluorescens TaxID=294 RepID=A0AAE2Q2M7_PSEFL|nr:hypothetical protein [Pseudomonas fluorescens]MBD8273012.1 hypothetical protein [Pseudomonas fluorescens]
MMEEIGKAGATVVMQLIKGVMSGLADAGGGGSEGGGASTPGRPGEDNMPPPPPKIEIAAYS